MFQDKKKCLLKTGGTLPGCPPSSGPTPAPTWTSRGPGHWQPAKMSWQPAQGIYMDAHYNLVYPKGRSDLSQFSERKLGYFLLSHNQRKMVCFWCCRCDGCCCFYCCCSWSCCYCWSQNLTLKFWQNCFSNCWDDVVLLFMVMLLLSLSFCCFCCYWCCCCCSRRYLYNNLDL